MTWIQVRVIFVLSLVPGASHFCRLPFLMAYGDLGFTMYILESVQGIVAEFVSPKKFTLSVL